MLTTFNDLDRLFGHMGLVRSRMNRLLTDFDRPYGEDYGGRVAEGNPLTNLYDNGDSLEIRAEVAGLTKEDLNIKIQGNYLEVSGTRKSDVPEGYKAHRTERGGYSFTRSFTLPTDVDVEKVEACLVNGILTLTLPKAEAVKPKQVTIN